MDLEDRYELLEKLGTGSFATVYRARDNELGREVAVKQIHDQYRENPAQLDRYWQEAQLLASLQHPNVVTIFDIYKDRGWLIMELMQANLADRMDGRQMDLRALRATLAHGLRALKYLHERGIIHGDIKTSNMMIDARRRVKVGDFGLARRASDEDGSLLKGTTKYMAPEVVSEEFGEVGPASDLYSLGFAAYELMCGPNFESLFPGLSAFGRNKQIAWMMWHAAPDRRLPDIDRVLEGVPEDLAGVIQKLCTKDQTKRYQTADEALSDLNIDIKVIKPDDDGKSEDTENEPTDAEKKKRLMLIGGAFGISMILCLVMLFLPGGEKKGKGNVPVNVGFVRSVEKAERVITWEGIEKPKPYKLSVGDDPDIFLRKDAFLSSDGKYITLEDIQPGDRIEWQEGAQMKIQVSRPVISSGTVRSYDLRKDTVTISVEGSGPPADITMRVPERAKLKLRLNNKSAKLGELREGDRVEIKHLEEVGGKEGRVLESLDAQRLDEQVGFLESLDVDKKKVKIIHGVGRTSGELNLPLSENCKIVLKTGKEAEGFPLKKEDLKPGDRLRYRFDSQIHSIIVHRSDQQIQGGTVVKLDLGRQIAQVTDSQGKGYEFRVTEKTDVTLTHKTASFLSLRENDYVYVLYEETEGSEQKTPVTFDAYRPVRDDRVAILIANETYSDDAITRLKYPRSNVTRLKKTLMERYAFNEKEILVLMDETQGALRQGIQNELKQVNPTDQLIVYFTGHAYEDSGGTVYLAGRDFRLSNMSKSGVPLKWLVEQLETCAAEEKILLLDATHTGKGSDLEKQPSTSAMIRNLGMPLKTVNAIASCDKGGRGHVLDEKRCGLFAFALCEGYSGRADSDYDLHITPRELADFLTLEMSKHVLPDGKTQRPVRFPN